MRQVMIFLLLCLIYFVFPFQKNGVPEAMIPGLYVIKEGNKIVLQIPKSGQSAVCLCFHSYPLNCVTPPRTNSPCQHPRKCIENRMENLYIDVRA